VKTRSSTILTFVLLAFAVSSGAQVRSTSMPAPANLNFEEGAAGEAPPGWVTPTNGFAAHTVEGGASGAKAALLAPIAGAKSAAPFGNLMQSIDAAPYRGRWMCRSSSGVTPGSGKKCLRPITATASARTHHAAMFRKVFTIRGIPSKWTSAAASPRGFRLRFSPMLRNAAEERRATGFSAAREVQR
jgi:hypothetical protein